MSARDIIGLQFGRTFGTESVDIDLNIGNDAVTSDAGDESPVNEEAIEQMDSDDLEMEGQELETEADEQEVEEADEEVQEAEDDIESLEAIQYALELSLSKGGLDTCGMEAFQIATNEVLSKYGVKSPQAIGIPSMEDYRADPRQATVVSLETVKDTLVSMKNGIVEFLKKLWFKIKQAIHNILNFGFSIEKKAKKLKEKAGKVKDNKDAPKNILVYGANKFIGKLNQTNDFNRVKSDLTTAIKILTGDVKDWLAISGGGYDIDTIADRVKKVTMAQIVASIPFRSCEFVVQHIVPSEVENAEKYFKTSKIGMRLVYKDIKAGDASHTLPTLKTSECSTLLDLIIKLNQEIENVSGEFSRTTQMKTKWADFKDARKEDDSYKRAELKFTRACIREAMVASRAVVKHFTTAMRGILDYVDASLKAHEKGGASKDSDKKEDKPSNESFTPSFRWD